MTTADKTITTEELRGTTKIFWIQTDKKNHKVRDKDISQKYLELKHKEENGELDDMYRKCPIGQATALLGISKSDLEDMVVLRFDAEGNGITEDPEVAALAWKGLSQIDYHLRLNPASLPIPSPAEIEQMRQRKIAKATTSPTATKTDKK